MLKRFFRKEKVAAASAGQIPDGERLYAIGDIHGRADLLADLLDRIEADDRSRRDASASVIFLGDLVDRGEQSSQVVELLVQRQFERLKPIFLMGNHEECMLRAINGDTDALRYWLRMGGRQTLRSYGLEDYFINEAEDEDLCAAAKDAVPDEHVRFLSGMTDYFQKGDYFFAHAGIRPGIAIEKQKGSDLRWIRGEFLNSPEDHGCIVVHGHSVVDEPEEHINRIAIDTGAYMSGKLTALALEGAERRYLMT